MSALQNKPVRGQVAWHGTTGAMCFSSSPTRAGRPRWSPVPVLSLPWGIGWERHRPELCHLFLLFANLSYRLLSFASVPAEGFQKIAPRNSWFVTLFHRNGTAAFFFFFFKIRWSYHFLKITDLNLSSAEAPREATWSPGLPWQDPFPGLNGIHASV